ncbi:hypothetical protein LBMAG18_04460 [Alphaproteobacteria bacterium]|nr:hypothetical protein LBMAG18_04460 [Alphaproteobacteria bacterium]
MTLEQINEKLEKLTSTQYEFFEITEELDIKEEDLVAWIDAFNDLQPNINNLNQKLFSSKQFITLKKIKRLINDDGYNLEQLKKILDNKSNPKKPTKNSSNKKHYFENYSKEQLTETNYNNQLVINFGNDDEESFNLNVCNEKNDQQQSQPENIDHSTSSLAEFSDNLPISNSQFITPDISNQTGDFDIYNKIDPLAKIKDFSNIKLYNIHPKLKEQLVHRLKCLNLNVEELTKILKNL